MQTLSFHRKLNKFVDDNELLPRGAAVVVACSGGPDSLTLLDWLLSQQAKRQLSITAAHFEHGIRGEESRADAAFVHDFCVSRGIPCRIGHGDVPTYAAENGLSMETAARELRYSFLRNVATECFSAIKPLITRWDTREVFLAVGHHGDDQAETVLMRILRGTGVNGLAAMRPSRLMTEWLEPSHSDNGGGSILPVHCRLIRPLLAVSRHEIEEYCVLRGLEPRHDSTNDEPDEARRNSLRLELLPHLKARYNPEINAALCHLAEIAADMSDCVSALANEKAAEILHDNTIDRPAFSVCPKTVQQAIIRKLPGLENCSYTDIEAMRRLICNGDSGQQLSLPGAILRLEYDKAIFARTLPVKAQLDGEDEKKLSFNVNGDSTKTEFCGRIITAVYTKATEEAIACLPAADEAVALIDADKVKLPLVVRSRRPGDTYLLSGSSSGRKKVKDYFIDRKVPREARERVPILTDSDGNILWLAGYIRSGCGMIDENTKNIIRVTFE